MMAFLPPVTTVTTRRSTGRFSPADRLLGQRWLTSDNGKSFPNVFGVIENAWSASRDAFGEGLCRGWSSTRSMFVVLFMLFVGRTRCPVDK